MAKLTLEIPQRTIDAVAIKHDYVGEDTPEGKLDFVQDIIATYLKNMTFQVEVVPAQQVVAADVEANVIITKVDEISPIDINPI